MIHPIPSGTRDVLPDEMRELRAITSRIHAAFEARGYGEIATPALEYEQTLARGIAAPSVGLEAQPARPFSGLDAQPAYRLFDEAGEVLVLRSDMTIPIARVAASRYGTAEPPLRFCYFAHAYRAVRPQRGQQREFLQAGIELLGAAAPDGTVEAISLLCEALDAAGLKDYRVGLGDASLYGALLDAYGVSDEARRPLVHELVTRDFVGLEREVGALELDSAAAEALLRVPQIRGGVDVLEGLDGTGAAAAAGLSAVSSGLDAAIAERVIFDLGLTRGLGYYTGAIFEVYDPAFGMPVGGGGRYDELLGRFGRDLPAVGFALNIEALHVAIAGEERDQ